MHLLTKAELHQEINELQVAHTNKLQRLENNSLEFRKCLDDLESSKSQQVWKP